MSYYYVAGLPCSTELYHHGIIGQKWGIRRWQNKDGSLTTEGRRHYGVSEATKTRVKNAVKTAGTHAKNAAKSAMAYTAKRAKMRHPSMMSDEELRNYTQRLVAEKNYSDLLRYQRANSGFGKAKAYVGDVLKRGGNILTDAGFRRIANKISKSKSERELEELQRENAIQALKDKVEDRTRQREIDRLTQENRISDLQDQLSDDGAQAQKRELERLQRERQLNDLRNQLDPERMQTQQQIDQLTQQRTLRDLERQINSNGNNGSIAAAMQVMRNPDNFSAADRSQAYQILKDYSAASAFVSNIRRNNFGEALDGTPAPIANASPSTTAVPTPVSTANVSANQNEVQFPTRQTYSNALPDQDRVIVNTPRDWSNYRMQPIDGSSRRIDYRMPSVESMESNSRPRFVPPESVTRVIPATNIVTNDAEDYPDDYDWEHYTRYGR